MNYDPIAQEYKNYSDIGGTDIIIGYATVFKLLGDLQDKRLLDYGCGTGRFCKIAKNMGPAITGVDISEKELEMAKEENPEIEFYQLDETFNLPKKYFDTVVINFVLSAVESKEVIKNILSTIHASLVEGGRLVILNSNYEKSNGREFMTFAIEKLHDLTTGTPVKVFLGQNKSLMVQDYLWLQSDYEKMLREAGFTIEKIVEPYAENNDHVWIDERNYPPFLVISAIK